MSRRNKKDKRVNKKIALYRLSQLFHLAETAALQGRLNLADRYVEIARRLSMRYLVPIPAEFKRCYCKHCYRFLLPGVSGRVRIHRGRLIMSCFGCDHHTRMPLKYRFPRV
jgi:ribonuclease P protein subunit RPR2